MRYLSILTLLFILSATAKGQVLTTIDITGGYSAPLAREMSVVERVQAQDSTFPYYYTTYAKMDRRSYGMGGNVALNINFYSKKNIGGGIKFNAFFGHKFASQIFIDGFTANITENSKSSVFSFQVIPHLCFRHDFKVVSPVLEAGMIIGMARINSQSNLHNNVNTNTIETRVVHSGNVLLGFYSSMGLSFNISKVVKINVGVNCQVASYSPAQWERKEFKSNGVNRLSALSRSSQKGIYVSSLDLTYNSPPEALSQDLKYSVTLSSLAFNAGISFQLGGKAKKKKEKSTKEDIIRSF